MENIYTKYIRHIRHFGGYAASLKDRADRAEAKLNKIIDELDRIVDDYIPDNDKIAPSCS
jgi:hypothetical protein